MITLATPVPAGPENNTLASLADARADLLNQQLDLVEVYGSPNGTAFLPSVMLAGKFVTVYLSTGQIRSNGSLLLSGGKPVMLTPTQLANVQAALAAFQHAVETELVEVGLFAGTIS